MKLVIATIAMVAALSTVYMTATTASEMNSEFDQYLLDFGKSYTSQSEYNLRKTVFERTLKEIAVQNANPKDSATYGLNHLSDYTESETQALYGMASNDALTFDSLHETFKATGEDLPEELDWRNVEGVVTATKDQASCGSCWAFATVAQYESNYAIHTNTPALTLAPQQLVDCAKDDLIAPNNGCNGGFPSWAYNYLISTGEGIVEETEYPYEKRDNHVCKQKSTSTTYGKTTYYVQVDDTPEAHKEALQRGTVVSGIDAGPLKNYVSGVLSAEGHAITHAVVIVGYFQDEESGKEAYIVRNSWGPRYGNGGYVYISTKIGEDCAIASMSGFGVFA